MAILNFKKIFFNIKQCDWATKYQSNFVYQLPILILVLVLAHIRVAISQKANKIDLPDATKNVTKLPNNNARVLLLLVDLLSLD